MRLAGRRPIVRGNKMDKRKLASEATAEEIWEDIFGDRPFKVLCVTREWLIDLMVHELGISYLKGEWPIEEGLHTNLNWTPLLKEWLEENAK